MLDNMNFYKFMHKQILVVIALFVGTGAGYMYMGWLYSSFVPEFLWFTFVLIISAWGYRLHRVYLQRDLNIQEREKWLSELKYFLFSYFSVWTIMFIMYVSRSDIELHYVAIATQVGVAVVSSAILVSQRKLAMVTLISLMIPIFIYFILLNEFYSYLLAFFTVVLSWVLLYASTNTYSYLVKSQYQAYHDYLTTLGNRRYFIELLDDAIKVQKINNKYIYLLLIDLDHFKIINDTLGHDIGDVLLCEVAERMKKLSAQNNSSVSRLGGDEFCVLSSMYDTEEECLQSAKVFARELITSIKKTYIIDEHHLYISASVGLSVINKPNMQASVFLKEADIAMYDVKSQGRDGLMIFNDALSKKVERKLEIERLLHFALENNEIYLNYQPQISNKDEVIGCEVLVRWNNKQLGQVPPDQFIPISEQTGMILELGSYILEESFKTLRAWNEKEINIQQLSINISMRQLLHNSFIDDVKRLTNKYLNKELCSKLVFEMTETSLAEDISQLILNINELKNLGIRFSMDDFGTGYSSLSYLRQIPIDELKIDKSFISEVGVSEDDRTMVKTILNIAKNLNLDIVAEGVETIEQKEFLLEEKCDILQGYYFSHPLSIEDFEEYYSS